MTGSKKSQERKKKILEILNRDGTVKVVSLSEILNATVVTIRSDLVALEKEDYLQRTSGGAVLTIKNLYKVDLQQRRQENYKQKKAIAGQAASLIQDGDTIIINSGTTSFFTACELKKRKNLNVVTNSLEIALELGGIPTFRVVLLGGEINAQYSFSYGNDAIEQLRKYKADWTILSIDGICANVGLTTCHPEESLVDRTMIDRARKTMVVADSTKMGREGFAFVSTLSEKTVWITDWCVNEKDITQFSDIGLQIIISNPI